MKKTKDFVLRDFIVPTNYVLLSHTNNYEASKDFHKFFVLLSDNQSWNHGKPIIEKLYAMYKNRKQARSELKLWDIPSWESPRALPIKTSKQKHLPIDKNLQMFFLFWTS